MGFGRLLRRLTKRPKVKKALKKLKQKNTAKGVNTKRLKKPFKVAPKSKYYISTSRSGKASKGLLKNKKSKIKNKKKLGG